VATNPAAIPAPFFAIFNGDVDTRLDGEGPESGGVWLDVDTLRDCVTITWDQVGFYRRNATLTDTFQMQLFDRGGGSFDVVYRYQSVTWTTGDLQGGWGGLGGTAARIGYRLAATGPFTELAASGNAAALLALPQSLGNTGVAGLWVFGVGTARDIDGTPGPDTLAGTPGPDTMHGLAGNDILQGSAGADLMDGGTGWDRVDFSAATTGLKIDLQNTLLNTGMAAGDRFVAVEAFTGTGLADTLLGSAAPDWFDGGAGNDDLQGRDGNDTMLGNAGADRLTGGNGLDSLSGDAGDDTLWGNFGNDTLLGGTGNDILYGGNGFDLLRGEDGSDTLNGNLGNDTLFGGTGPGDLADALYGGDGRDSLDGGDGNDSLWGGLGSDTLLGGGGADTLWGMEEDDSLWGGAGADQLFGGAGNDRLDGGPGADRLTGGPGADRFFNAGLAGHGQDWINDFSNAGGDRLVFGITTASRADFRVTTVNLPGAGLAGVAEVRVTYIPTGMLVWTIVDGADDAAILMNVGAATFDLL
jgi:Ca2+-binding RTX toxin-like protein